MMNREKCMEKVAALDATMAKLNEQFDNETDQKKRNELTEEIMSVARQTNHWLKLAGEPESEMYYL